jgi:hypothetical protein
LGVGTAVSRQGGDDTVERQGAPHGDMVPCVARLGSIGALTLARA